ncbi:patatin-like phospholipase family protein [Amycolatopsis umgeniensis]|uniref:NTE family protein n=1 Tax=Amycolatopsis umgeniensis TaxID=336628 RepID=A0A841B263_9PSEU|nr:patatin-like phospholipase family protein [Amycolatopsis umgeniensis]MBB5852438.1 NTE family protein [Amycolatopsis umgeniensis]
MADSPKRVDLVLEGGGVKGIGLLGAVLELHEAGYSFPRIAGTSAGAIVATLVAAYQKAGKDLGALEAVMNDMDCGRFQDQSLLDKVTGPIGDGVALLLHDGMHTGDYLAEWLTPLLEEVGVRTFADLAIDDPEGTLRSHQRYSLVVHVSDLTRRVLVRLPWDYSQYGRDPGGEKIVDAVRASMSIPFYFRPVQFDVRPEGTVTWVDGGLLSNFPITVFDRTDAKKPRWPTWGVKLSGEPVGGRDKPVKTALRIAISSLETLLSDWNRYRLHEEGVNRRTMCVDTTGVSAVDFGLGDEEKKLLFENGREAARRFLEKIVPQ